MLICNFVPEMKIFGIEKNYPAHNNSQNDTLYIEEAPVLFTKADSALLSGGKPFFLPDYTQRCECGAGIVVRICHLGRSIPERFAHRYYEELTVGIDFTARDLLDSLSEKGMPWEVAKGFDGSAAVGRWIAKERFMDVQNLHFRLEKNGQVIQESCTCQMLHKVDALVSYISQFFTLKTGDLIYTGTPSEVDTVDINDHLVGYLEGENVLEFNVK